MDYKYGDDMASKNDFIQARRELKVESLVNDSEYDESKLPEYMDTPTMGLNVYSKNVVLNTYRGITKWQTWITELEKIAVAEYANSGWTHLCVSLSAFQNDFLTKSPQSLISSYEEYLQRRFLSRTISSTSYIATSGRRGPGNVAFIGSNVVQYFSNANYYNVLPMLPSVVNNDRFIGSVAGIDIINCPEINPDRVIVFRGGATITEPSLMLVEADFDDNRWAIVPVGKAFCISYDVIP
jgi:hypothetical protein